MDERPEGEKKLLRLFQADMCPCFIKVKISMTKLTQSWATAAGIAATAAGLTYLDGKYHLKEDWKLIRAKSKAAKMLQKAST